MRRLALLLAVPLLLPVALAWSIGTALATTDLVLCDGQTWTGWTKAVYKLDASKDARMGDPAIRKVIRGCTFTGSARSADTQPAIVIVAARNVLITGSTFADIHTGVPGQGVHAIAIRGAGVADGVTIEMSTFEDISADGVQAGDSGPSVTSLVIRDSVFTAPLTGGENAVDIKGTLGPTLITGNDVGGYHPCDGSASDCSGSQGAGIVIHDNGGSGARPQDVTISDNRIHDNERGVTLAQVDRATVTGNDFCANVVDVYLGSDNGAYTVADNTSCAPSPPQTPASPSPSPSASPTPLPTPTPSPAPTPAPTPGPTPQPWWCPLFWWIC